jgi:glyoxylase-like metal-dependent hydrolase (beta-lactamase superfamily II)
VSGVSISFLQAGYCTHPERAVNVKGSFQARVFPASVAVIQHPREGVVLFDTGYSERFFDATRKFPQRLYRWVTPVFLEEGRTAKIQLERLGIREADVRHVILSHFHADHVGAVSDFRHARYIYNLESYNEVRSLRGFSAVRKAFLPALLPDDFLERSQPMDLSENSIGLPELKLFRGTRDLFGDGTLWLVELPGHTEGHMGLFVRTDGRDYLLAGDAAYVRENFTLNHPPSSLTRLLFSDFREYMSTLNRLRQFHLSRTNALIVPCHCKSTLEELA